MKYAIKYAVHNVFVHPLLPVAALIVWLHRKTAP